MARAARVTLAPTIETVLADPAASHWLKDALRAAMVRDCVDAANDARVLAQLLRQRADAILHARPKPYPPMFALREDRRPQTAKTAAGRLSAPGLFD